MKFKKLLVDKGYSQSALAKELGVSQQLIHKWITKQCRPQIELIPKIARLLNVSIDELLKSFLEE